MALLSWPPRMGPVPNRGPYRCAFLLCDTACVTVTDINRNRFDSSAGQGTYVYDLDYGATPSYPDFSDVLFHHPLLPGPYAVSNWMENDPKRHRTACLSKGVGKTVGIARKANVVAAVWDFERTIYEHWLDGLAKVHADIFNGARGAKSVINLSISIPQGQLSAAFVDKMGT